MNDWFHTLSGRIFFYGSALLFGFLFAVIVLGRPTSNTAPVQVMGEIRVAPTATIGVAPTPVGESRVDQVAGVVTALRAVSRLETREMDIKQDIIGTRKAEFLGLDGESIQVHIVGTVIGRVDLSGLTTDDNLTSGDVIVSADGKAITIWLPAAELTRPLIDPWQTSFNNHSVGWLGKTDPNLWQMAYRYGVENLVTIACEHGMRDQTSREAERQVRAIFRLRFSTVTVKTRPASTGCGGSS